MIKTAQPETIAEVIAARKTTAVWVTKIIRSCSDTFHFDSARKLIELFADRYGAETAEVRSLLTEYEQRFKQVHNILN